MLADWLQVDLHWLQYGPSPGTHSTASAQQRTRDAVYAPTSETIDLVAKIEALSPHQRYLIEELVDQLYGSVKII